MIEKEEAIMVFSYISYDPYLDKTSYRIIR